MERGGAVNDSALRNRRILVVEDEYLLGISLHDSLEDAGATVIGPIGTIPDALHALESCELDFAVLDVNLAGVHVYPVADALREHGVPFVFTTGYDPQFIPKRFGNSPVVPKPCDSQVLCGTIEALIAGECRKSPGALNS
jgi:DNA-binding response OmpR family regulator